MRTNILYPCILRDASDEDDFLELDFDEEEYEHDGDDEGDGGCAWVTNAYDD